MQHQRLLKRLAGLASVLMALTLAPPADATVAVQLSRTELVTHADLIVRATVLGQTSGWNTAHTQIVTLTRLQVSHFLKGGGPDTLTLRQFGGTVDNLVQRIAGDARFTPGQDVVLFLRQGDGVVFLTAMAQSAYYVQPGADGTPMVHRDLHDLAFAQLQATQMTVVDAPDEAPESFQHLAASVAAGGGAR